MRGGTLKAVRPDFNPKDYIDPLGWANILLIKGDLRDDYSSTGFIVGKERSGKTDFSLIWDSGVDPTFDTSRVVFPTNELKRAISKCPPHCFKAISQDEGAETWLSDDANSTEQREMIKYFMQSGYKNLCITANLPDFSKMTRYMKGHRIDFLIRIIRRGTYAFYSENRIKEIKTDLQSKRVIWPKPNFIGWFKQIPKTAFWHEVERKKTIHLGGKEVRPEVLEMQMKMERFRKNSVNMVEAAKMMSMKRNTFHAYCVGEHWSRIGGLKPFYIGKERRFFISDVMKAAKLRLSSSLDNIESKIQFEEAVQDARSK